MRAIHLAAGVWVRGLVVSIVIGLVSCQSPPVTDTRSFDVVEASVADIHEAMARGQLTARALVEAYLARIEAYDTRGPALNAIVTVNPNVLARADALDAAFASSGLTGPLHGIPIIVKDNYDTSDLPTTGGSLSLEGSVPPDDAFQVRRILEAGGIVLAKSNMAEFAFSPYETVGSALPGYTRNPYAPRRVTAGSSGGTAAAVAASFGTVGLSSCRCRCPDEQPGCQQQADRDEGLRTRVRAALAANELDALVYPTWDNPPRLIGDLNTPHGNNSFQLSPPTGFPAITVPMGFVGDGLPAGLQILGDAWSEPRLIAIAYAFEQGTQHRIPPPPPPPLE